MAIKTNEPVRYEYWAWKQCYVAVYFGNGRLYYEDCEPTDVDDTKLVYPDNFRKSDTKTAKCNKAYYEKLLKETKEYGEND